MEIERISWFPDGNSLVLSHLTGYIAPISMACSVACPFGSDFSQISPTSCGIIALPEP